MSLNLHHTSRKHNLVITSLLKYNTSAPAEHYFALLPAQQSVTFTCALCQSVSLLKCLIRKSVS